MAKSRYESGKYIPGSDARSEEIFTFPFFTDADTVKYITEHGRVMFLVRGPPGSGKSTLTSMITTTYPTSVVCSADKYFNQAFVSKLRNKETLTASHQFCQRRVKEECAKGTHPVVIQNTHMRRWEMREYLDFANQYGYTLIMAITVRKFVIDPKILEQTNKKGLNQDYLKWRVSQWQECIPLYLGWFLGPDDESFVFGQSKQALENLLGDGKFCNVFKAYCKEEIWKCFMIEKRLFCVATYLNHSKEPGTYKFYLSDRVQNVYGKCFSLCIHGFVVTQSSVLGVVAVTGEMKSLMMKARKQEAKSTDSSLNLMMDNLSMQQSKIMQIGTSTFTKDFTSTPKSAELRELALGELMNTNFMSFVLIARARSDAYKILDVQSLAQQLFEGIANNEGVIEDSTFSELDNGTKYYRMPNNSWLISLPKKIYFSAVFTGLYD